MVGKIFVWLLTTVLLTTVPPAEAQQAGRLPTIGYLAPVFPCSGAVPSLDAFRQGLRDVGYVEGQNISIACRSAAGKSERLRDLAAELVQLKVDVLVAAGGEPIAFAAKQATQIIPIIMTNVGDPVASGLVASLDRPGGNLTGLATVSPELSGKRLELLKEAFATVSRIAVFRNPANPGQDPQIREMKIVGQTLGLQLQILEVRGLDDFDTAFSAVMRGRAHALVILPDPLTNTQARRIADFAAKHRLPAMYHRMESIEAGGLMAYGPNYNDLFRRAAVYVDKILKGSTPADLPVEQPTKFEFIINLKTAKQMGLTIPPNVLARADRVIK